MEDYNELMDVLDGTTIQPCKNQSYKESYPTIFMPDHPKAFSNGYIRKYTLIAEAALGKYLPSNAQVHHHNGKQLVICQNCAYHFLLHQRTRAYEACGHANWRKCAFCKQYDDLNNLTINGGNYPRKDNGCKSGENIYHKECRRVWERSYKAKKKAARFTEKELQDLINLI